MGEDRFNRRLLEAVDEAFTSLGDAAKLSLYWHLERVTGLNRAEIPVRLEDFHKALTRLLGPGAKVLERLIVRSLYGRLGLKYEDTPDWGFLEYIEEAKRQEGVV